MIIERQQNRRQREEIYRKQLLQEIQSRKNQSELSKSQLDNDPRQQFSLIKNIEAEQQRRKNRQKEYYQQLQRQRQQAIQLKKKKIEQEKMEQEKMDEKIRKQNQFLRRQYEEQLRQQKQKKNQATGAKTDTNPPKKKSPPEQKYVDLRSQSKYPKDIIDDLEEVNQPDSQFATIPNSLNYFQSYESAKSYPYLSRIENQDHNFPPKRPSNNSYFKQLLRQRRKLDEETNSLKDLHQMIQSNSASGTRKQYESQRSGGISQLKQISQVIYEQSQSFMRNRGQYSLGSLSKTQNESLTSSGYYNF